MSDHQLSPRVRNMKPKDFKVKSATQYALSRYFIEKYPGHFRLPMRIKVLADVIGREIGDPTPITHKNAHFVVQGFYDRFIKDAHIVSGPDNKVDYLKAKDFYNSYEWANARYDAIKRSKGCCEACGMGKKDGVKLNVDHIKPLRLNWELKSDPNNLQVLCELCNKGKGNRDETDWR